MPNLRDMIDGKTVSAAGIAPPVFPQAGNNTSVGGKQPKPKVGAAPPPGNAAKPTAVKAPKGPSSPLANHIGSHLQDPAGATKDSFTNLTQAKLQYDTAREEAQRGLAPVQTVIDHLTQMHGLTPRPSPTPPMVGGGQMVDPNTGQPMPGQDPMNPGENDNPDMDPQTGNPANMSQTTGRMNQNRPSMAGHQPGVAPGPANSVVPGKMGMPKPGAPGAQKGQVNPQAAKPKGNKSMPGAKGPGDPKVAGKTDKAQSNSSRAIKVNVSAAAIPPLHRIHASYGKGIEKYLGFEKLRMSEPIHAAGSTQGSKKGWSTRGKGHLSKTEKKAHYKTMDSMMAPRGGGMRPPTSGGGFRPSGGSPARMPSGGGGRGMLESGAAQGNTKVSDSGDQLALNPVMRSSKGKKLKAHGKGCLCASCSDMSARGSL